MENRRRLVKAMSFRLLELPMLRRAAAMHYTSRMELEDASRFELKNLQRVIPIGMDLSVFDALPDRQVFSERFPQTAKTRNILFLSRIDVKKGLDLLISAFAVLGAEQSDLHLIICGSGDSDLVAKLQAQAGTLGITEKITWAGLVTGELRLAAFAAAEIFVLPSHAENFGIALLEAMAAGLPCLSTDQVALAADASFEDAVQLTAREPQAIVEALRGLLSSEGHRRTLAGKAYAFARRDYSLSAMGTALHKLYQEVCHRGT
jgi:glycosyltransferase involved in cell wall biosynthesis